MISPLTNLTSNGDGSFNIRIVDKKSYYSTISQELESSHLMYSDVKIVSKGGSQFDAHKAILSRCKRFAGYFQNFSEDEKLWIYLPEASPDLVRQALRWFYDTSSDLSQEMQEEIWDALEAVIGKNPNKESDQIRSNNRIIDLEEGQVEVVNCKINRLTGKMSCPFCAFYTLELAQMTLHLSTTHGLKAHGKALRNNRNSGYSSDDDSSTDNEEFDTELPFKCKACDYTSYFKYTLIRHYATEHYKEKLIDIFALGIDKRTCSACNFVFRNTTALVVHLADDHSIVRTMIEVEFPNNRKEARPEEPTEETPQQIESSKSLCCFFCNREFEVATNFIRHLAWFHFKTKMLTFGNSVCNSGTCLPSNSKDINKVFHLALRHNGLKFCMTAEDYKKFEELTSGRGPIEAEDPNLQSGYPSALSDQPTPSTSSHTESVKTSALNGKRKSSPSKPPLVWRREPTMPENGENPQAPIPIHQRKVCTVCKKAVRKSMANHRKICKGPQFPCHICGIFHASSTKLFAHYGKDHFKRQLTQKFELTKATKDCRFCNFNFHNVSLLRTHLVTHHGGLDGLVDKSLIQKHLNDIKDNTVCCNICKRGFTSRVALKRHIETLHTVQPQA